jgi:hypothetical protein
MATAAQIAANQSNAQFSTGPRSAEGKSRVSQNAFRHGLTARHLVIRPEDEAEFTALRDDLAAELAPQGVTEILTFNELLHAAWNLRRLRRLEAEASTGTLDDFTNPQTSALLDRLSRYQTRAQRAYYKALAELRTLQTHRIRRGSRLGPQTAAQMSPLVVINDWTKQTQSQIRAEVEEKIETENQRYNEILDIHRRSQAENRKSATPAPRPMGA